MRFFLFFFFTAKYKYSYFSYCYGDDSCCLDGQCGENQGDCDSNSECAKETESNNRLVCGENNCVGSGYDSTDDCCEGEIVCVQLNNIGD